MKGHSFDGDQAYVIVRLGRSQAVCAPVGQAYAVEEGARLYAPDTTKGKDILFVVTACTAFGEGGGSWGRTSYCCIYL